jgi:hypothetical protein
MESDPLAPAEKSLIIVLSEKPHRVRQHFQGSRTVYRTAGPYCAGLTVSPDGRRILYTQFDRPFNQDLMLVEGFR